MKFETVMCIFIIFLTTKTRAQTFTETETKNAIICELFGNSYGFISINYEKVLFSSTPNLKASTFRISTRLGIGFGERIVDSISTRNIPIEVSFFYGRRHNFDGGMGFTPCIGKPAVDYTNTPPTNFNKIENVLFLRLGYRYWDDDGLIFRIAPMLQMPSQLNWEVQFTLGLAAGYSF